VTTLRDYVHGARGTFFSPNHPVPISGQEYLNTLGDGDIATAGHADFDLDLADMPITTEIQGSGDVWIYPADRSLSGDSGPLVVHHPEQ
jgi:hypothetical protein